METILYILNELAALVILLNFVICVGIFFLTFRRIHKSNFRSVQRLIRVALVIGVSLWAMFSSLSLNHLSPISMPVFGAAALLPTFFGMLLIQYDDSRQKKNKVRRRIFFFIFLISFTLGAVPALFESGGMNAKLFMLLYVLVSAVVACFVVLAFTELSEDDYCTQCGYYAGIDCIQEDVLEKNVSEWDSAEWTETRRGNDVISKSPTEKYRNTRIETLVRMHLQCQHCGHEYIKEETREVTQKKRA